MTRSRNGTPGGAESTLAPDGALFELVLGDRTRVKLVEDVTIGRAPGSSVRLSDPSVSRLHARISPGRGDEGPVLEDAGSSYGTFLDGQRVQRPERLRDGARIRVGNQELLVERHRNSSESGRTIVVPANASLALATDPHERPRLRSGYALKRLPASEGPRRWVLRDLQGGGGVRLTDQDAQLMELLDGRRSLAELVHAAETRVGPGGAARLAQVLADLDARGFLAGAEAGPRDAPNSTGALGWLLRPRELQWRGAGDFFQRIYERGAWVLFSRPVLPLFAVLVGVGIAAFTYLLLARYGTPFVVANKVGVGGLVFIAGRLAVAAVHETAHGLAMASFGRRVGKAGIKLLLIFPYVYVDTSEMWFEGRARRIAVTAAGPVSDFSLAAIFSLSCMALPAGTTRDVFFQLAFAAYLGGLFNLNPLLERDGYQILVDLLDEPKLRRRALEQLRSELGGGEPIAGSPVVARYSLIALGWWVVAASFAAGLSIRYLPTMYQLVPHSVAWLLLGSVWIGLFIPVMAIVGPPVSRRLRSRRI